MLFFLNLSVSAVRICKDLSFRFHISLRTVSVICLHAAGPLGPHRDVPTTSSAAIHDMSAAPSGKIHPSPWELRVHRTVIAAECQPSLLRSDRKEEEPEDTRDRKE